MPYALPTLNINQPIIDDDHLIMLALLKFMFWNPGWTSSQIEDTLLSMRKLRAQCSQDIPDFPQAIQTRLRDAVQRYHPEWKVTVSHEMLSPTTYKLIIAITDEINQPVINMDDFVVRDGEILLKSDLQEINTDGY
jgi:hypothetical protein